MSRRGNGRSAFTIETLENRRLLTGILSRPTPATASIPAISGTSLSLHVLGGNTLGESLLHYTRSVTSAPTGAAVNFSSSALNTSKNTVATFNAAGTYLIKATMSDSLQALTNSVPFTVMQTPGQIVVAAAASTLPLNTSLRARVALCWGPND